MDLKEKTIASLKKHAGGDAFPRLPATLPKASVLIPLLLRHGEVHALMTVRSVHYYGSQWGPSTDILQNLFFSVRQKRLRLKQHAGEVCFPGGKSESGDTDETHTALREAQEEIGLPPHTVQVVCRLFPILNKAGLLITPVVAFIESSFVPRPNADEVSEVFTLPLEFFTKEADHSCYPVPSTFGPTHSFLFTDPRTGHVHQIWGLTAALAVTVAALALGKEPEFELGFDLSDPASAFKDFLTRRLSKL